MTYTICITGERKTDYFEPLIETLLVAHYKHDNQLTVLVGDCDGVDESVVLICKKHYIDYKVLAADWLVHGKAAGPIRNKAMIDLKPDLVLAFHRDLTQSRGTKNTISLAKKCKIPVEYYSKI